MTDAELVYHETGIPLDRLTEPLRSLTVDLCRMSMGELLVLTERVEAKDPRRGRVPRMVFKQRQEWAELRELRARLEIL